MGSSPTSGTDSWTPVHVFDHSGTPAVDDADGTEPPPGDEQPERRVALTLVDAARELRRVKRARRGDANAPAGHAPTVATVPANHSLTTARQIDKTRRALGGITELAASPAPASSTGPLPRVITRAPDPFAAFPCGASTRRLDSSLRIKFSAGDTRLGELLGWRDGTLDTVCVNGWLMLTQRPDGIGAARGRCSNAAGFTVASNGVERIALRPAHAANLGVDAGDSVLVAAMPDVGGLVIVDPAQILAVAPRNVLRAIAPDGALLTVVHVATSGDHANTRTGTRP